MITKPLILAYSKKIIDFHGSVLDQYQLPIVLYVFAFRRIVFILSFSFYLLRSSKYAECTPDKVYRYRLVP